MRVDDPRVGVTTTSRMARPACVGKPLDTGRASAELHSLLGRSEPRAAAHRFYTIQIFICGDRSLKGA